MPHWSVSIPISGILYKEVEAPDKKSAIQTALEQPYNEKNDEVQWESMERITYGNVFAGMLNEASAKKISDD